MDSATNATSPASATSCSEDFEYDVLPAPTTNIRLLRITHADEKSITCKLRERSLRRNLRYTAISYVWGCPDKTKTIIVNGKRLYVTQSCWQALRQVHNFCPEARIWIDAVCINQTDDSEKCEQVKIMGLIYARAERVVAVLAAKPGFEYEGKMAAVIADGFKEVVQIAEEVDTEGAAQKGRSRALGLIAAFHKQGRIGLLISFWTHLNSHPYWKRAWIRQEVLLARRLSIFFSGYALDVPTLAVMMVTFSTLNYRRRGDVAIHGGNAFQEWLREHYLDFDNFKGMRLLATHGMYNTGSRTLIAPIEKSLRGMETLYGCQKPRDRLYSLLSITSRPPWCPEPITPDYSKPILEVAYDALDLYGSSSDFDHKQQILIDARILLIALEIGEDNDDIKRMVIQRRTWPGRDWSGEDWQHWQGEKWLDDDDAVCLELPPTLLETIYSDASAFTRVKTRRLLREHHVDRRETTVAWQNSEGEVMLHLRSSCDCSSGFDAVFRDSGELLQLTSPEHGIVCLLSCSLRSGDCVVTPFRKPTNQGIILRPFDDNIYELVGQAVMMDDVCVGLAVETDSSRLTSPWIPKVSSTQQTVSLFDGGQPGTDPGLRLATSDISLCFSKDDLFAYIAQDLGPEIELSVMNLERSEENSRRRLGLLCARLNTDVTTTQFSSYAIRLPDGARDTGDIARLRLWKYPYRQGSVRRHSVQSLPAWQGQTGNHSPNGRKARRMSLPSVFSAGE